MALVNVPGSHLLHLRSAVAVGAAVWRSPATHTVCLLQKLFPLADWKDVSEHAAQASALVVSEKCPGAHGVQTRSEVALGAKSSCSPGTHCAALAMGIFCASMQKKPSVQFSHRPVAALPNVPTAHAPPHAPCPGRLCHWPHGQLSHAFVLLPFLKRPAAHGSQWPKFVPTADWPVSQNLPLRSVTQSDLESEPGSASGDIPAFAITQLLQLFAPSAPITSWNLPREHAVHVWLAAASHIPNSPFAHGSPPQLQTEQSAPS
jgi:hypothetical protein